MSPELIARIRRTICLALEDMGGVNTRLREIEDLTAPLPELENDVTAWLEQAGEILTEAAQAVKQEIKS